MKTIFASMLILLMMSVQCDARGRGGHSSGYSSSGYNSGGYSSHRNSYNHGGRHYRGYVSGDRTPSGYYGRSPGLLHIDHAHESAPPGANITGNSFYRGVDRHGALMFGN